MSDDEKYPKMYLVINTSLGMRQGKIASQIAHSSGYMIRHFEQNNPKDSVYMKWWNSGTTKIVLKATQKEIEDLMTTNQFPWVVKDAGRTQVAPNSVTCVGSNALETQPDCVKNFKLL